jgi:hypothetical protein
MTCGFADRNSLVGGGFVGELSLLYLNRSRRKPTNVGNPLVYRRIESELRRAGWW